MPIPQHTNKAGLWLRIFVTLALLVSGYVLYPAKLYTPEETYQVAVVCKNTSDDECEIFKSAVLSIENFTLSVKYSEQQKNDVYFIFVVDRVNENIYKVQTLHEGKILKENKVEDIYHNKPVKLDPQTANLLLRSIVRGI